jgi:hypothetical protein
MKTAALAIALTMAGFAAVTPLKAAMYTITPSDADLGDLDHNKAYSWGFDRPWKSTETVKSATLNFSKIYDWENESNVLYIHLLDTATKGITTYTDNEGGGDYFKNKGIVLTVYRNLSTRPQDLSYTFTASQLQTLTTYAADGKLGLGLDPDCHFYNCGVSLNFCTGTTEVPEPATMSLLAMGGLAVFFRKRRAA